MTQVSDTAVDAVFVIGTGSKNNNEELRYALRNIEKHCKFVRNVYISGECPSWINKDLVKHLKWPDRFHHAKDANIVDKLRHACEEQGIAKNILFCSDDQFQTRECTWDDFSPRWLRKYSETDDWYEQRKRIWHNRLRKTLERERKRRIEANIPVDTIYYYQPHMWMQIDRDKFIEYAKWSNYEQRDDTIIASGYFNYINAGGDANHDHVFIGSSQSVPEDILHIAYSDPSYSIAMSYLKRKFKEPSKYELLEGEQQKKEEVIKSIKLDQEASDQNTKETPFHGKLKKCSSCEEKRNGARLEHDLQRQIIQEENTKLEESVKKTKHHTAMTTRTIYHDGKLATIEKLSGSSPQTLEMKACIDCAIDHLSVSIAYMNSNAGRPDLVEIELAKGEVFVAAQHLLALKREEEYNTCIKILDSVYTENSLFSVPALKDILQRVINTR